MPSKSPLDAPYTAAECKQQLRRTVIASSADTSSSPSSVRMLSAMPGKHNSRSGLGFSETPCMESFKLFKPCSTNVATPRRLPVVLRLLDIWNALWINARDIQWCLWADTEYEVGSWRCNNEIVGKSFESGLHVTNIQIIGKFRNCQWRTFRVIGRHAVSKCDSNFPHRKK